MNPDDLTADLLAYEAGELGPADTLTLFQCLIDSGLCWWLRGHYSRHAHALIRAGLIVPNPR